jgi:hypothetical protein
LTYKTDKYPLIYVLDGYFSLFSSYFHVLASSWWLFNKKIKENIALLSRVLLVGICSFCISFDSFDLSFCDCVCVLFVD